MVIPLQCVEGSGRSLHIERSGPLGRGFGPSTPRWGPEPDSDRGEVRLLP